MSWGCEKTTLSGAFTTVIPRRLLKHIQGKILEEIPLLEPDKNDLAVAKMRTKAFDDDVTLEEKTYQMKIWD